MSDSPGPCILIVEDNLISQKLMIAAAEQNQCTYLVVADGRDALHQYNQGQFALILMDCQLQKVHGLQAVKGIRELEKRMTKPRCPILGVSANSMKANLDKCREAGMDDFIPKPFRVDELSKKIRQWIQPAEKASA